MMDLQLGFHPIYFPSRVAQQKPANSLGIYLAGLWTLTLDIILIHIAFGRVTVFSLLSPQFNIFHIALMESGEKEECFVLSVFKETFKRYIQYRIRDQVSEAHY